MGNRNNNRLSYTLYSASVPSAASYYETQDSGAKSSASASCGRTFVQGCGSKGHGPVERSVHINTVCGPAEKQNTTSVQLETIEQVCRDQHLQDGRSHSAQVDTQKERLHDETISPRCILLNSSGGSLQKVPEVLFQQRDIRISVPSLRTFVRSKDVHEGHEASHIITEETRTEGDHLSRRSVALASELQRANTPVPRSMSTSVPLGFHHQEGKMLDDASAMYCFSGWASKFCGDDSISVPADKLRDLQCEAQEILTQGVCTIRNLSSVLGLNDSVIEDRPSDCTAALQSRTALPHSVNSQVRGILPEQTDRHFLRSQDGFTVVDITSGQKCFLGSLSLGTFKTNNKSNPNPDPNPKPIPKPIPNLTLTQKCKNLQKLGRKNS